MTYRPGNPTRTCELLAALAASPGPEVTADWAEELGVLTATVRSHTTGVSDHGTAALAYELAYHWCSELDRLLTATEHQDPALWQRVRTPGTWLDSLLRLRSVLTHVISKAYWSTHTEIAYGDIEIERYLWGAR